MMVTCDNVNRRGAPCEIFLRGPFFHMYSPTIYIFYILYLRPQIDDLVNQGRRTSDELKALKNEVVDLNRMIQRVNNDNEALKNQVQGPLGDRVTLLS